MFLLKPGDYLTIFFITFESRLPDASWNTCCVAMVTVTMAIAENESTSISLWHMKNIDGKSLGILKWERERKKWKGRKEEGKKKSERVKKERESEQTEMKGVKKNGKEKEGENEEKGQK